VPYTVRPITDHETLRQCEDLQIQVWGASDREIVPFHHLIAAISSGGLVLGGFAPDGALVGFAYAFPGWLVGAPLWHSHMTGVLPAHRSAGLGLQLKRAQREHALAAGIDRIVWTYDPLRAGNARFNLDRLGTVASRYHADYYGVMSDAINRGLASDRFEVDWFLRSPRVVSRLTGEAAPPVDPGVPWALEASPAPQLTPGPERLRLHTRRLLVEIPADLDRLKVEDLAAAAQWRQSTRTVFTHYFAREYSATEALRLPRGSESRIAYLLEQPDRREGE